MAAYDTVTLAFATNFVPTLWSTEITEAYIANLVFGSLVDRRWEKDIDSGRIVRVPNMDALTVQQKTNGNAINWLNPADAETKHDITVDKDYYVAIKVDNIAEIQTKSNLRQLYTQRAGKDLAVNVDGSIATLFGNATNFTQNVGTLGVDIVDDNMRRAAQYLNDANAPVDDRALVVSPATLSSIQAMDKFVRLDYHNINGATAVEQAQMSSPIYGAKVYCTTAVNGCSANHNNIMFQRGAMALIMQQEPKVFSDFLIDYLADGVVIEAIWGLLDIRPTSGVQVLGK